MGILELSAIRQRIAAGVEAIAGAWSESPFPPELFPSDSRELAHLGFAVEIGAANARSPVESSGRGSRATSGALTRTDVRILFTYRVRLDNGPAELDGLLDAEVACRKAVMGVSEADLHVRWISTSHRLADTGDGGVGVWYLSETLYEVDHRTALA